MHQVNPNDNRASRSRNISSFFPLFSPISVIFQDGGQTANFRAKDYKAIVERAYSYLCTKSIQMINGLVEAEMFCRFLTQISAVYQDGGQTVNFRATDDKDII